MYNAPVPAAADPTAVIGRRIGAFIVNFVIFAIALVVGLGAAEFKSEDIPPALQRQLDAQDVNVCDLIEADNSISLCFHSDDTVFYATGANAAATVFGIPIAVSLLNSVVLASIAGGSLGKLFFGLRVVKRDTMQKAGFGAHLLRWVLWLVDGIPCFPLVGLITGLTSKGHRRVGDMAAGTLVVAASSVGGMQAPAYGAPAAPAGAWAPPAPGGFGAPAAPPAAPGAWAPPAPAADPWAPPAPAADPWAPPAAPAADVWSTPAAPAADPWATPAAPADATMVSPSPQPAAPQPEPTAVAPAPDAGATTGPQWDAARNAYIQWEPVSGQWMQFDDAAQEWRPLT